MNDPSKKVLITGADGALGSHVARKFLDREFDVAGTRFPVAAKDLFLDPMLKKLRWIEVDLARSESVRKCVSGHDYDILIHCAGGFRFSKLDELQDKDLDFLLDVNLRSSFNIVREILPGMKKRNFGRIILISANATLHPSSGMAAYLASKASLNQLTAVLTEETRGQNITVNAILPSIIDTPRNRKDMPNARFEDWVKPESLSEIIYSLVSPWGDAIRGALIPVVGRV